MSAQRKATEKPTRPTPRRRITSEPARNPLPDARWLSAQETADEMGIGVEKVKGLCRIGKLPGAINVSEGSEYESWRIPFCGPAVNQWELIRRLERRIADLEASLQLFVIANAGAVRQLEMARDLETGREERARQ